MQTHIIVDINFDYLLREIYLIVLTSNKLPIDKQLPENNNMFAKSCGCASVILYNYSVGPN